MKRLFLSATLATVLAFGMTSCKKDYTCDCKNSQTGDHIASNPLPNTRLVDARKACKDRQSALQNTTQPSASCTIL